MDGPSIDVKLGNTSLNVENRTEVLGDFFLALVCTTDPVVNSTFTLAIVAELEQLVLIAIERGFKEQIRKLP